ncbi:hypothetical protein Q8F55_002227 [Vanrija albida]|uniref:Uncharacterized protein n=1 Tax=Vanrija albida TaxID=181172 RepID=A0ABR3Q9C1_9TREE
MLALRIAQRRATSTAQRSGATALLNAEASSSRPTPSARTFGGVPDTQRPRRRRELAPQRAAAFRKAKEFAAQVNAGEGPRGAAPRDPDAAPTLADLTALRPARDWRPRDSGEEAPAELATYAAIWQRTYDAVDKAFVVAQLRAFCAELGLNVASRAGKPKAIAAILESWGWARPKAPKKRVRGTRDYDVSAAELFLLQRDAGALRTINELGVDISAGASPGEGESQSFTLSGAGAAEDLDELGRFLHDRQVRHIPLQWAATEMRGWTAPRETLGAVARTTGAYVERVGWGQYVATGTRLADVERARDLVLLAAARATAPTPPLAVALPSTLAGHDDPQACLVPHGTTPGSRPPWDVGARVGARGLFRLVQADAVGPVGALERAQRATHLDHAEVVPLGGAGEDGSLDALARRVLAEAAVPTGEGDEARALVFRFGHLLTPSDTPPGASDALVPPKAGTWPLTAAGIATGPLATLSAPIFAPAIPPALTFFPLPEAPTRVRRVSYVSGAGERLVVEYAYARAAEPAPAASASAEPAWFTRLDEMMKGVEAPQFDAGPSDVVFDLKALETIIEDGEAAPAAGPGPLVLSATVENEAAADVLLPARPTDARVLGRGVRALAQGDVPAALGDFFAAVHAGAGAAAKIPLADLDGLRRGVPTPEAGALPARRDAVAEEDETEYGVIDELEADVAEAVPAPAASTPPPVLPPASVALNGETYHLSRDEVADVVESAPGDGPTLRTLSVADLRGTGGVAQVAELEAGEASPALWAELASITRAVPPDARRQGMLM